MRDGWKYFFLATNFLSNEFWILVMSHPVLHLLAKACPPEIQKRKKNS